MPLVLKDRVRESSTSTGTGAMTLLGALPGFQPFSVLGVGNTTYYTITGPEGTWETGVGTLSAASTLQRTTVIDSSAGGAKVNFAAGVKDVFVTGPGSKFFVPEWATQDQAEAGTDNTTLMTPLRTAQAIETLSPVKSVNGQTGAITIPPTPTSYGDVGTYVIAGSTAWAVSTQYLPNTTVAGSTLVRSSSNDTDSSPLNAEASNSLRIGIGGLQVPLGLSGTWRLMTRVYTGNAVSGQLAPPVGLFVRIV